MATATILKDGGEMAHWPPQSTLVELDPPLQKYDVDTGEPDLHKWIVVQRQQKLFGAAEDATYIFAVDGDGGFVREFMTPLEKREPGQVHSVLKAMGYKVTN